MSLVRVSRKRAESSYERPTPEKRAYGLRLKSAREVAGMSLTDAATALGYSQPVQLSLMENGKRMPTLTVIVECTKLYGTTADYLCGLVEDGDRDPATTLQRHVTGRVTADLQRLIQAMARASVDVVRELMPSAADGQRLAGLVIESSAALAAFRRRNPKFDDLPASAALASKLELASTAAAQYAAQVERSRRLMQAKSGREVQVASGPEQFSLLPALDLIP